MLLGLSHAQNSSPANPLVLVSVMLGLGIRAGDESLRWVDGSALL